MKSRHEMKKQANDNSAASDDMKKTRKLKPLKKEKNIKRVLFDEIDEMEEMDPDYTFDDDFDNYDEDIEDE
ncbi:MAG TPA: hypothetical protein PKL52_03715 [Tenuifilaceae bacterium]|nr:hypothetical protein [Tenuifilaceae bacterium]